jgi:hypothetical protein
MAKNLLKCDDTKNLDLQDNLLRPSKQGTSQERILAELLNNTVIFCPKKKPENLLCTHVLFLK